MMLAIAERIAYWIIPHARADSEELLVLIEAGRVEVEDERVNGNGKDDNDHDEDEDATEPEGTA